MITAGIDCGTQRTKGVLVRDGEIVCTAVCRTDFDTEKAVSGVTELLLEESGISPEDITCRCITGIGAKTVPGEAMQLNEILSAAAGISRLAPECRYILDLGAERSRVIRLDEEHDVQGYEVNDKCASGSGTFIEAMARALSVPIGELGSLALSHEKEIDLSAQCVVFVESEVISLIHANEAASDIAWGVLKSVASHVAALANRAGKPESLCVIGGLTANAGFMEALRREMKLEIKDVPYAEYASAYGAALAAARSKA